jgi:hypothetical protein
MPRQAMVSFALLVAIIAAAGLSRLTLTEIESRKQIIVFWILAIVIEAVIKPRLRVKRSLWIAFLTALCATGAILLVRWYLKGFCPHTWPQCPDPIYAFRKSLGI